MSTTETTERRWGEGVVPLDEWSLPALKAGRALSPSFKLKPGSRVLDYGCGEGKLLNTLRKYRTDLQLYGLDIQEPKSRNLDFDFKLVVDGRCPHFSQSFDYIMSLDVLEHVPDLEETLKTISGMLSEKGEFHCFVPMEGERLTLYGFYRWLLGQDLYMITKSHRHAYRRRQFLEVFSKYFEVQEITNSYHFIGAFLDATFFALARLKSIGDWFWQKNSYYRPENKGRGGLNVLLKIANVICYWESTLLCKRSLGSMGLHIRATKKRIQA